MSANRRGRVRRHHHRRLRRGRVRRHHHRRLRRGRVRHHHRLRRGCVRHHHRRLRRGYVRSITITVSTRSAVCWNPHVAAVFTIVLIIDLHHYLVAVHVIAYHVHHWPHWI